MVPQPQRDTARLVAFVALDDARHFGSHGNNLPRVRAPKLDESNWINIVVHLLVVFLIMYIARGVLCRNGVERVPQHTCVV
jgi:hypothetical protein